MNELIITLNDQEELLEFSGPEVECSPWDGYMLIRLTAEKLVMIPDNRIKYVEFTKGTVETA